MSVVSDMSDGVAREHVDPVVIRDDPAAYLVAATTRRLLARFDAAMEHRGIDADLRGQVLADTTPPAGADEPLPLPEHWIDDPTLDDRERRLYRLLHDVWCSGADAAGSRDFRRPDGSLDEVAYLRYQRNAITRAATEITALHQR